MVSWVVLFELWHSHGSKNLRFFLVINLSLIVFLGLLCGGLHLNSLEAILH